MYLTESYHILDVAAVKAMLEEESKGVTIVSKHLPSTEHTATPSCDTTASTGADATVVPGGAGSDTWFEVCIDPEVYRRLEDSVRVLTEGECCIVAFLSPPQLY